MVVVVVVVVVVNIRHKTHPSVLLNRYTLVSTWQTSHVIKQYSSLKLMFVSCAKK